MSEPSSIVRDVAIAPTTGGVTAPQGFRSAALHCGIKAKTGALDLTVLAADATRVAVEVSDRFHVKPLLRSATFPQAAFVLALSQNGARLIEVSPDAPPVEVRVPSMPRDAASAVGKSAIADRAPDRRLQGRRCACASTHAASMRPFGRSWPDSICR